MGFALLQNIDTTISGQPAGQPAGSSEAEDGGMVMFFKS
jgi:hypothetical protein